MLKDEIVFHLMLKIFPPLQSTTFIICIVHYVLYWIICTHFLQSMIPTLNQTSLKMSKKEEESTPNDEDTQMEQKGVYFI